MELEKVYFKDDFHKSSFLSLMDLLKQDYRDPEYFSFAYLFSATGKVNKLDGVIDEEGIDVEKLYELISVFSNSERSMIRFALQCFNAGIDDITLPDVMRSLDSDNEKVVLQAIKIRYKVVI